MLCKRIQSEEGSSAIEFALYMFVFVLMCGFLMDMSFAFIKKGRVERVNSSLMMIFNERLSFYNGVELITKSDLINLKSIADMLLRNKDGSIDDYQLSVRMVYFVNDVDDGSTIDKYPAEIFYASQSVTGCDLAANKSELDSLTAMSVFGYRANPISDLITYGYSVSTLWWSPVYEITLCVPDVASYFNRGLGIFNEKLSGFYVRNVSLPRK